MKSIVLVSLLMFCAACGNTQVNDKIFITKALPADVGVKPELLNNLISDIQAEKIQNIHGLLIIKEDKLITEEYFGDFSEAELHYTASVSKSFASTLLGIAIDKGFFEGEIQTVLNRNVSELFPEYADLIAKDSLKEELKLKHFLTMTAGFQWDEHSYPYSDSRNDCNRLNMHDDPMKFLFDRSLVSNPGTEFYYNGGLSLAISYLIEKYTEMRVDRFAEKYLFKPLGIDEYRWEAVANGLIDTDGGLHLKPIDQAKLGYLFLHEGVWGDQRLVSKEWAKEVTKIQHRNTDMPDYSYQWWCGDFYVKNKAYFTYFASGHGGQKVLVLPEYDVVIVITQQVFSNPLGDFNFIAILSDYILPALTGDTASGVIINMPQKDLTIFEGHYTTNNSNEFMDIVAEEGKLLLSSSDGQQNEFYPVAGNIFESRILDILNVQIEFVIDKHKQTVTINTSFGYQNKQFSRLSQI